MLWKHEVTSTGHPESLEASQLSWVVSRALLPKTCSEGEPAQAVQNQTGLKSAIQCYGTFSASSLTVHLVAPTESCPVHSP